MIRSGTVLLVSYAGWWTGALSRGQDVRAGTSPAGKQVGVVARCAWRGRGVTGLRFSGEAQVGSEVLPCGGGWWCVHGGGVHGKGYAKIGRCRCACLTAQLCIS